MSFKGHWRVAQLSGNCKRSTLDGLATNAPQALESAANSLSRPMEEGAMPRGWMLTRCRLVAGALAALAAPIVAEAPQAGKLSRIGSLAHGDPVPAEVAAKHRVPAVYGVREHVEAGGLIAYSSDR